MGSRRLVLVVLFLSAGVVLFIGFRLYMSTVLGSTSNGLGGPTAAVPHIDHRPKHGGTFFMCMDSVHHLEGVLTPEDTFRVYLYDAFTRPVLRDEMKEANGYLEVGETANPLKVSLQLSRDERTLEGSLGKNIVFPVTLTLYLHLPGSAPDAKPELFTFEFNRYSVVAN